MNTIIKPEIIESSVGIVESIFSRSTRIMDILPDASEMYQERIDFLKDTVGETGVYQFAPVVTKNLVEDYKGTFKSREDGMPRYRGVDNEKYANSLGEYLYSYMTNDDLLNNSIPEIVKDWVTRVQSDGNLKGYSSPKLSKILVKLYGENADVVKWYTNKCPKKLVAGKSDKYIVTLSVLPHHIAGMSYYSPRNCGEKGWIDGWEGSSCMDTILNSGGEAIVKLVPNITDSFLAIAYLSIAEDFDTDKPKYLSRMLVRAVQTESGDWVMLGCRAYNVSNEVKEVLLEGLSNEFNNFVSVYTLRQNEYNNVNRMSFTNEQKVMIDRNVDVTCGRCEGDGTYDSEECGRCNGEGKINKDIEIYPYIDDSDFLEFVDGGRIKVSLPESYLVAKGFVKDNNSELLEMGA